MGRRTLKDRKRELHRCQLLDRQGQGVQGWKMSCLRPAPPTRSFIPQHDKRNTLRRKEVETSSYEDDLQILRVIEAYCTSKQRQTITNSAMLDPPVLLADEDTISYSRISRSEDTTDKPDKLDKIDKLDREVAALAKKLEQEV